MYYPVYHVRSTNQAIKFINSILLTLIYNVNVDVPLENSFSLYFTMSEKLNFEEKIMLLKHLSCKAESDVEVIEHFISIDKDYSWFISHNGGIKSDCIEWFSSFNCFIDQLCFESESNNNRWLIMNMCKSDGILLMLNKDFTKSKWCMWELQIAKLIKSKRPSFKIFPIVLEGDFIDYPDIKEYPGKSTSVMRDRKSVV